MYISLKSMEKSNRKGNNIFFGGTVTEAREVIRTAAAKCSVLLVTAAISALVVGAVFSSASMQSAYATQNTSHLYCFNITDNRAAFGNGDSVDICYFKLKDCKIGQASYAAQPDVIVNSDCQKRA